MTNNSLSFSIQYMPTPPPCSFSLIMVCDFSLPPKNGGTTVSRQLIDGHDRVGHGRHVTSEEFHKSKRNLIAVVRDPIDHFLSGWGECGNRFPGRKAKFNTTLPYDERVKNWLVYVKDYCPFGGNTLCACKRHSYPQANFLLTNDSNGTWALHPRLEIVGDLRELKEVLSFVGLKYNEDIEPGRNASKSETKQRLFPREKGLISDTTMIELCQFLALDYLLFDFEPPDVCQNEIASLLINTSNSGAVKVVTPTPPMVTDRGTEETPETHSKSLNKPKLIIHIGPRKTGTTTIHSAVFNKGGDPDYVKEELSEDNFRVFDIRFRYGQKIIAHLNSLSGSTENSKDGEMDEDLALKMARQAAAGKDLFDQLQKELGDSLHENKHFAFLHETWSSLKPTEEAKKALLTATEGFNVTVVMTYRPLYDYYRSLYLEHRKWNIRNYGGWNEMPKSSNQWCQAPLRDWLPRVWSKYSFGDPLIAYETMAYIFGEDSIKVLELKSDLAAQFVCKGMGADHACKKAKNVGEPKIRNTSDEKTSLLAEEDLIIMAAHKKGMMPTTAREGNCTITNREKYKALLNSYLSLHGLNIKDLPRLCLTEEQLDSVKERSWKAEKLMAPSPRTHESFRKDFEEMLKSGQLCNVDVDAALSNPMIINFISDKERSLQCPEPELD